MKTRAVLLETLASRKALFDSLVMSAKSADKVRADIARRRAALDAEEKRFNELLGSLPIRLSNLDSEIQRLENALADPDDAVILALR